MDGGCGQVRCGPADRSAMVEVEVEERGRTVHVQSDGVLCVVLMMQITLYICPNY